MALMGCAKLVQWRGNRTCAIIHINTKPTTEVTIIATVFLMLPAFCLKQKSTNIKPPARKYGAGGNFVTQHRFTYAIERIKRT